MSGLKFYQDDTTSIHGAILGTAEQHISEYYFNVPWPFIF